jgi:hypothetical protein
VPLEERHPGIPEDVDVKAVERTAHHEAGHMVVAAALGLKLRPQGLRVDPRGWGLACYCKQPDGSDLTRERIIVATFAGFIAQKRFYPDSIWCRDTDWSEAHALLHERANKSVTRDDLLSRSERLVRQHWPAIEALAAAVLAKDWVTQERFESGARWSHEATTTEKRMACEEVVDLLGEYGISAVCVPSPL